MNWTLVAVIGILIIFSIIGLKQGIIKMALSCAFVIVTIALTGFLSPTVKDYIRANTDWYEKICSATQEYFEQEGLLLESDTDEVIEVLPDVFQKKIDASAHEYLEKGYNMYNSYIVNKVSELIFSTAVMIGIFALLLIVFIVISIIIKVADKLPVVNEMNRFAGLLVGLAGGILVVSLGFIIITMFSNTAFGTNVFTDISNNELLSFLYNKNILLIIIAKIF